MTTFKANATHDPLAEKLSALIAPLGLEVAHVEVLPRTLRVFIDRSDLSAGAVGIEDCAAASRALDEPLDAMPEVDALFQGTYELEVSSPGIDRPLRKPDDYQRFSGQDARLHVVRPLTAEECENAEFIRHHPKQRSFLGTLCGLRGDKVLIAVRKDTGAPLPRKKKEEPLPVIAVPAELISKAHLEPSLDLPGTAGRATREET